MVTKESAKIDGYPQLSIRANHMVCTTMASALIRTDRFQDMTKFGLPDNEGYRRILGEVKRWLRPLTGRIGQDEFTAS